MTIYEVINSYDHGEPAVKVRALEVERETAMMYIVKPEWSEGRLRRVRKIEAHLTRDAALRYYLDGANKQRTDAEGMVDYYTQRVRQAEALLAMEDSPVAAEAS